MFRNIAIALATTLATAIQLEDTTNRKFRNSEIDDCLNGASINYTSDLIPNERRGCSRDAWKTFINKDYCVYKPLL